jgi:hypothetical protein
MDAGIVSYRYRHIYRANAVQEDMVKLTINYAMLLCYSVC